MVTREELDDVFGEDNNLTVPPRTSAALELSAEDAEFLTSVGLPAYVGAIFTIAVVGSPTAFTLMPVRVGEDPEFEVLVLGGPADDEHVRYFLDREAGYVTMLVFEESGPMTEVINSSLASFAEFLYRFALCQRDLENLSDEENRRYTAEVVEYLTELDPVAFRQPDAFWSLVFARPA